MTSRQLCLHNLPVLLRSGPTLVGWREKASHNVIGGAVRIARILRNPRCPLHKLFFNMRNRSAGSGSEEQLFRFASGRGGEGELIDDLLQYLDEQSRSVLGETLQKLRLPTEIRNIGRNPFLQRRERDLELRESFPTWSGSHGRGRGGRTDFRGRRMSGGEDRAETGEVREQYATGEGGDELRTSWIF